MNLWCFPLIIYLRSDTWWIPALFFTAMPWLISRNQLTVIIAGYRQIINFGYRAVCTKARSQNYHIISIKNFGLPAVTRKKKQYHDNIDYRSFVLLCIDVFSKLANRCLMCQTMIRFLFGLIVTRITFANMCDCSFVITIYINK